MDRLRRRRRNVTGRWRRGRFKPGGYLAQFISLEIVRQRKYAPSLARPACLIEYFSRVRITDQQIPHRFGKGYVGNNLHEVGMLFSTFVQSLCRGLELGLLLLFSGLRLQFLTGGLASLVRVKLSRAPLIFSFIP